MSYLIPLKINLSFFLISNELKHLLANRFIFCWCIMNRENLFQTLFVEYATALYRFATVITKTDNLIAKKEGAALKKIYQITHNPIIGEENSIIKRQERKTKKYRLFPRQREIEDDT